MKVRSGLQQLGRVAVLDLAVLSGCNGNWASTRARDAASPPAAASELLSRGALATPIKLFEAQSGEVEVDRVCDSCADISSIHCPGFG